MSTKPGFNKGRRNFQPRVRMNNMIRSASIRLIDDEGTQMGVVDTKVGLDLSRERGLDLVEVSSDSEPPVCRIMDYSKYKYEQEKKRKLAKKKQHVTHMKEIRFKVRIDAHDYDIKIKHVKEFLEKRDKVRISLRFRGRENAHKELGVELLNKVASDVSALGEMEEKPKSMGRTMSMTLIPKSK